MLIRNRSFAATRRVFQLFSKYTKNPLAAGALSRIPLKELTVLPDPLAEFEGGAASRRGEKERKVEGRKGDEEDKIP